MQKLSVKYAVILFVLIWMTFMGCSKKPLETVNEVNLEKYAGVWYEIAMLPNSFQKNCKCTTAEYTPGDKFVEVRNRCFKTNKNEWTDIRGKAFPVKASNNSKLKVQFFWPFRGDYYIMKLDEEYRYVLVGNPSRKYLWILSRTPELDTGIFNELKAYAAERGFPVEDLVMTPQDCE